MKKLLAILLATLLLVSLIACGKDDVAEPTDTDAATDTSAPADKKPAATTPDSTDDGEDDGDGEGTPDNGGDDDGDIETVTVDLNKNTKGIKLLGGRGIASDSQINLDWSGSGIEFVLRIFQVLHSVGRGNDGKKTEEACRPKRTSLLVINDNLPSRTPQSRVIRGAGSRHEHGGFRA